MSVLRSRDWRFLFVTAREGFPLRVHPPPHLGVQLPEPFSYLKRLNLPHTYKHIGFDENFYSDGLHTGVAVAQYCMEQRPDVAFVCCQYLEGAFDDGVVLRLLREVGVPVVLMWLDSYLEGYRRRIANFKPLVALQLIFDDPVFAAGNDGLLYAPPPIRDTLLAGEERERDIDVCFAGNYRDYGRRAGYLAYVEDAGIKLWKGGGQGYQWRGGEFYDTILLRSKIALNFPWTYDGERLQIKARVYEALAAGTLLLESANPLTPLCFRENADYIPFTGPEDLVQKIRYYLEHERERREVAQTGQQSCLSCAGMEKWWDHVLWHFNKQQDK